MKKCAFSWFLLHMYITMHGSKNVKFPVGIWTLFNKGKQSVSTQFNSFSHFLFDFAYK